jgi:hypothetical protein
MITDFHLAPERNRVHQITMPHISPAAVDHFVQTIALLDGYFRATFNNIGPSVILALGRTFRLKRVRCHETLLFPKVLSLAWRTLEGSSSGDAISSVWLDGFERQYIHGAMCFTAVDVDDEPLAVFLQETTEPQVTLSTACAFKSSSFLQNACDARNPFASICSSCRFVSLRIVQLS